MYPSVHDVFMLLEFLNVILFLKKHNKTVYLESLFLSIILCIDLTCKYDNIDNQHIIYDRSEIHKSSKW